MALSTRDFETLVDEQARAAQAAVSRTMAGRILSFAAGSVFLALAEAYATVALWLQGMVLRVLAGTRAATAQGEELHSWMADFGIAPLPGAAARGNVVFSRFTPNLPAIVPVGALVRTDDGAWTYAVVADAANPAFDATRQGYLLPPTAVSVTAPVLATGFGRDGNAAPGTVTLLATAMPGVDTCTNPAGFAGGQEGEGDAALRARFRRYIASLPSGVRAAIEYAALSVQPGLTVRVIEAQLPNGQPAPATFTLVVDDGTGAPPSSLLERVAAAVETQRALGITYYVAPPLRLAADVSMALTVTPEADPASVVAAVSAALRAHIDGLPLGSGLSFTRLSVVAYGAAPEELVNITEVRLNAGTVDVPAVPRQAVRSGLFSINAATQAAQATRPVPL